MDNNSNKSGNNFFSGFLLGALIGAAVVFLLATKKGKKILKAISEEGEGKISNILGKVGEAANLDEVYEEEEEIAPKKQAAVKKEIKEKPKIRRFFKGISRRLN